jgi:predicted nucleic acid-binding protein
MIYVDTSVAAAYLFVEDRVPPNELWRETLVSSRLLEYELWTRVHARKLSETHGEAARLLIGRVSLLELLPIVSGRVLEPFPVSVRTLDAMHLASIEFLRSQGHRLELATYDKHMQQAARRMGIPISVFAAA